MKESRPFLVRFYLPLLLALIIVLLTVFTPKLIPVQPIATLEAELKIGLLGLKIPLATWVENEWIVKLTLLATSVLLVLYALNINFSLYFPHKLKLDAYFDIKGIQRTLDMFPPNDHNALGISADWMNKISEYDKDVVTSLKTLWQNSGLTNVWPDEENLRDVLHAAGETTFITIRVGFLTYKIVESEGRINYEADFPRHERRQFRGEFHLRDTVSNYIRPNILRLIRSPTLLIAPQFMQVFQIASWASAGPFDHILIAATRISILPFPSFSDSIYLWKADSGEWIPVAYCIYH